ncbi:MAG: prepilin-type N-terminal cleavage/methylation domain-containing protein [Candidatus Kerfeldbacteria bacterium]|nr:prepilin-type N-terminal cleavage/methylation domain-containing protein [Candidatus Kerfeldbacteria bacterium]
MNKDGFTIIEMMVVTAIIAMLSVMAAHFLVTGLNIQRFVSEQNDAIAESRKALKTMVSELRETVPADTGAYPIEDATEQEIIFYSDVDKDNETERVRYFLEGTNIQRGIIEPSGDPLEYLPENETVTTISHYIQNGSDPVFTYYNQNYPADTSTNPLAEPTNISEIRLVEIRVLTNVDPNRVPDTRELEAMVMLRNLKENF